PAAEPLARLVPHDNYYFTVQDPIRFVQAWDILDNWGGSVLRSPQLHARDHAVRARYERQLCLPAADVVKALPGDLVTGLAVTGSDLFWQDGSDVTVLIEVSDVDRFLALHKRFIDRTRAERAAVRESKATHRGQKIESLTTPWREVSLYRTV